MEGNFELGWYTERASDVRRSPSWLIASGWSGAMRRLSAPDLAAACSQERSRRRSCRLACFGSTMIRTGNGVKIEDASVATRRNSHGAEHLLCESGCLRRRRAEACPTGIQVASLRVVPVSNVLLHHFGWGLRNSEKFPNRGTGPETTSYLVNLTVQAIPLAADPTLRDPHLTGLDGSSLPRRAPWLSAAGKSLLRGLVEQLSAVQSAMFRALRSPGLDA